MKSALEKLGEIGQLVAGLDIKTMVEQWKAYARLAFQYVNCLKSRLDIASPLKFLAEDVSKSLEKLLELVSNYKLHVQNIFSLKEVIRN